MLIPRAIPCWLLTLVCGCCAFGPIAKAQSSTAFKIIRRVDGTPAGGRSSASAEAIQAFDISPDGSLLAVLFQSESQHDSTLRILIENVGTGRPLMQAAAAHPCATGSWDFPPPTRGPMFSFYRLKLAVHNWENIRVVKSF